MKANLHTHTIESDGAKTVQEMVNELYKHGINILSKTDHDTLSLTNLAKETCEKLNIKYVNGVEITAYSKPGLLEKVGVGCVLHVLGLGYDYNIMQKELNCLFAEKYNRLLKLLDLLIKDGYKIDENCLTLVPFNRADNRILAEQLVNFGYAKNLQSAFKDILNSDKYFSLSNYPYTNNVISAIKKAGGYAIWAHPYKVIGGATRRLKNNEIEFMTKELIKEGLDGLETYYFQFSQDKINFLEKVANSLNLLKSIGTDYHATNVEEDYLLNDIRIEEYTNRASDLINLLLKN